MKATCEDIQNIGNMQGEDEESKALAKIAALLPQVKREYSDAHAYLNDFYDQKH